MPAKVYIAPPHRTKLIQHGRLPLFGFFPNLISLRFHELEFEMGKSNQTQNFFIWSSLLFYSMYIFQVFVVLEVDNRLGRWT
jgi:hypothetical protein